jgi:hypothetical protein
MKIIDAAKALANLERPVAAVKGHRRKKATKKGSAVVSQRPSRRERGGDE